MATFNAYLQYTAFESTSIISFKLCFGLLLRINAGISSQLSIFTLLLNISCICRSFNDCVLLAKSDLNTSPSHLGSLHSLFTFVML